MRPVKVVCADAEVATSWIAATATTSAAVRSGERRPSRLGFDGVRV
jgi:hypothetical protein